MQRAISPIVAKDVTGWVKTLLEGTMMGVKYGIHEQDLGHVVDLHEMHNLADHALLLNDAIHLRKRMSRFALFSPPYKNIICKENAPLNTLNTFAKEIYLFI